MKNLTKNKYFQLGLTIFSVVICSIIFFFLILRWQEFIKGIENVLNIFMPIIFGLVIAYILNPSIKFLETNIYDKVLRKTKIDKKKHKSLSRILSILTASVLFLVALYVIISYIIPEILASIQILIGNIPNYIKNVQDWLANTLKNNPDASTQILENYQEISTYILNIVNDSLTPTINNLIVNVSNGIVGVFKFLYNFIIGFIISIYLLNGKEHYIALSKKITYSIFDVKVANNILEKCRFINKMFGRYMVGVVIDCCFIGLIMFLFNLIFQMPYGMLIAVICAITNAIPYFGPFIGAIPSTLLILLVSPPKAIIFVIFIIILQQFDGMYLAPKIIGNKTGLARFWVLCSILVSGGLFGFVGLLIGVPIFAIIYTFIKDLVNDKLKHKNLSSSTKKYQDLLLIDKDGEYVKID